MAHLSYVCTVSLRDTKRWILDKHVIRVQALNAWSAHLAAVRVLKSGKYTWVDPMNGEHRYVKQYSEKPLVPKGTRIKELIIKVIPIEGSREINAAASQLGG